MKNLRPAAKHRGAFSELAATVWLLSRGYEVFRNVSQHGLIDILAVEPKTKRILKIDCKSVGVTEAKKLSKNTSVPYYLSITRLSPVQEAQGILVLYVLPNGECCWTRSQVYAAFGLKCPTKRPPKTQKYEPFSVVAPIAI